MIYDLLVIGGGIHGAACAQAAAAAGYSTLVLEQYEKPGMGTSSKSSKLIHGGLRYLESGQFKLVRECLQERKYLLKNAPQLVELVPFHIPVYRDTCRSAWAIRLGLMIYSLFSRKPFHTIAPGNWAELDGLKTSELKAVFQYYDAQTDDHLLTRSVIASAQQMGTDLLTSACFESADCSGEFCISNYRHKNKIQQAESRAIINTAGPWANHVLDKITPSPHQQEIDLVLGTHIIVNGTLEKGMYYLEAPEDRRAVFVMPWKGKTMIGTTETHFRDSPENVTPPVRDIEYLLQTYNHYFTEQKKRTDVIEAFAGLRVLPADCGKPFARSRDTIIHHDNIEKPKVFTLYGGKLTAHRATANQLIKTIRPHLPARQQRADTKNIVLPTIAQ